MEGLRRLKNLGYYEGDQGEATRRTRGSGRRLAWFQKDHELELGELDAQTASGSREHGS